MLCETCTNKTCDKKPCKEVADYLKSQGIYSADFIRPQMSSGKRERGHLREIPFSALSTEDVKRMERNSATEQEGINEAI